MGKSDQKAENEVRRVGLCLNCLYMQRIESDRGSTFYRCQRSDTDPSFSKYPRLPVLQCPGYASSCGTDTPVRGC